MKNQIFHLNSFVNADKKTNMGFSDFITLGFVSPCSDPIPETVAPLIDEMAQNRLREAILQQKEWPGKGWLICSDETRIRQLSILPRLA